MKTDRIVLPAVVLALSLAGAPHRAHAQQPDWSAPATGGAGNAGMTPRMQSHSPATPSANKAFTPPVLQKPTAPAAGGTHLNKRGDGAALLQLLSQPDSATATLNGHNVSAGALRAKLRGAIAKAGKPRRNIATRRIETVQNATELSRQNAQVLSAISQAPSPDVLRELKRIASSAPSDSPLSEAPASNLAVVASTKACPERGPGILESKGSTLTPGAMVALRGSCLGANPGEVRMLGDFPGGMVKLHIDLWTDDSVAATVPADLSGVIDQTANVQVVRADGALSNARRLPFTARRETAQLSANLLSLTHCAPNAYCDGITVSHTALRSDDENTGDLDGTDTWQIGAGNGWVLQGLSFDSAFGTMTASGFEQGAPGSATVQVAWDASQSGSDNADNSAFADVFRPFMVENKIYWYNAAYSLSVTAVGPAGVSPDPSVKPPYTGQGAASHGPRSHNGITTAQDSGLGQAETAPGAARTPNWGTAAAEKTALGTGSSSSSMSKFGPRQLPGSWTTPKPGDAAAAQH